MSSVVPGLAALLLSLQAVISVRTEVVTVPVTVTDDRGNHVSGLRAENFRVLEDGQPQEIAVFDHGDTPVTLGLVIDRSQSMRPKTSALRVAVWALLQSSHSDDELFAVDFSDRAVLALPASQPFTNDPRELETALRAARAEGQTALYDGVAQGLEHLRRGRAARRVLIIVSDGGDNASRHTYTQIRTRARQSNVVIYAIGLMGLGSAHEDEDAKLLERLCQDTGGTAYFPRTTSDLASESMQVARTIRQQYTLGFLPRARKDGKPFRKIDVKVTASGRGRLHVRTRSGYAVPGDRP